MSSSAQQVLKAKKELDANQPEQAIAICDHGLSIDPQDVHLLYIKSLALIKVRDFMNAWETIGMGQKSLKLPKDEGLIPQFLIAGLDVANQILQSSGSAKQKKEGIDLKINFLMQLVDFIEKKEKWDKFFERIDELIALLTSQDMYGDIEQLYMRIYKNSKLPNEKRHEAIVNIFNFPEYCKPKLVLTLPLLNEIIGLNPQSQANAKLSEVLLKSFDKRPKFFFYENRLDELPKLMADLKDFINVAGPVFFQKDFTQNTSIESLFKQELSITFKFLVAASITLEEHSSIWKDIIAQLTIIEKNAQFESMLGVQTTQPLFILIKCLLDAEANIFKANGESYLSKIANGDLKEKELASIKTLVNKKYTPIAHIILCDYLLATNGNYEEVLKTADNGITFIKDLQTNGFSKGLEWEAKLFIIKCKVLLSNKIALTKEQKSQEFQKATLRMKELAIAAANFQLINKELPEMIYHFKMHIEGFKGAKEFLDDIEKGQSGFSKGSLREDWVKSQKAWLTYSYLEEITTDKVEQSKIIEGVAILLKEALTLNPQNVEAMIRLGTLYFMHELSGITQKHASIQWLTSLKAQQNNPEIFYCLGLYYYFGERDLAKAIKCLDKALLLKPDLEECANLYYHILIEQGQVQQAFSILERVQQSNPLLTFPYYFKGLRLQNSGDYANARLMFENAARYHGFISANISGDKTKQNFPSLKEVLRIKNPDMVTGFNREIGEFSNSGLAVWLHLAECYLQLEKYPTAEKCLQQVFSEIKAYLDANLPLQDQVQKQLKINRGNGDGTILSDVQDMIHQFASTSFITEEQQTILHSLNLAFDKDASISQYLQLDLLETLLLAGKVELKLRRYHHSLMYASLSLENLNKASGISHNLKSSLTWELVSLVMDSLLLLIDENLGGKVDRKQLQKTKYVTALKNLVLRIDSHSGELPGNERLRRLLGQSFKVIGEETSNAAYIEKAIVIFDQMLKDCTSQPLHYKRGLKLDLARLYHLKDLFFPDQMTEASSQRKISIVRDLIKEFPGHGEYWVYHGIFSNDQQTKVKSFFKALQLDPKDQFALNNLLCLYLRHGNYPQALKVLSHIRDIDSLNAIVIALMVILHARLALEAPLDGNGERKHYLAEAISIGEMFLEIEQEKLEQGESQNIKLTEVKVGRDPRVDIHSFLSRQMSYLVTIMQMENGDPQLSKVDLREILKEKLASAKDDEETARLLSSMIFLHELQEGHSDIKRLCQTIERSLQDGRSGWNKVVQMIHDLMEHDLEKIGKNAEDSQKNFILKPSRVNALQLVAMQERCLKEGLKFDKLMIKELEIKEFRAIINSQEKEIASKLVHQQLQLLFMKQQKTSGFAALNEYIELLDENAYDSLRKQLPEIEYEKVFKLYLMSLRGQSQVAFTREIKRTIARGIEKINTFLDSLSKEGQRKSNQRYEEIMRKPSDLSGFNHCLWKLIKDGEVEIAKRVISVVKFQIEKGIITSFTKEQMEFFQDYCSLIQAIDSKDPCILKQCKALNQHLLVLVEAFILIQNKQQKHEASLDNRVLEDMATNVIMPWLELSESREELQEDQMAMLYSLMSKLLLQQGYLQAFNDLSDKLLTKLGENPSGLHQFFQDEFKVFLMVNMASNSNLLGKKAQSNKLLNEVEKYLKEANPLVQKRFCLRLVKAALKLSLKQDAEAEKLIRGVEDESYEKSFMLAQSLYALQEYKRFYLLAIELVASLKQELQTNASQSRIGREQMHFTLGTAYFLKAKAEITFMEARKQGITLKEDFTPAEGSRYFAAAFFQDKAKRSLEKAKREFQGWQQVQKFVADILEKL